MHSDWPAVAKRQHGVIARAQLDDAGVGRGAIARLVQRGALVRAARGIYRVRGAAETYESMLWLAQLATNGVLGYATACQLWGMITEQPSPITVILPADRRAASPAGVQIRYRSHLQSYSVRWGLKVSDRVDALFDHLGTLPGSEATPLFDRAMQRGWMSPLDIELRLRSSGWGTQRIRSLSRLLGTRAASELERRFHRLLQAAGVTGWIANFEVRVRGAMIALVDVAFAEHLLAIELDGMAYHSDAARFRRDRRRQNQLVAAGWRVLRFTWDDVLHRPSEVVANVVRQLPANC
ncbi:MAG: hypothetical protein JWN95_3161 [Frankiales bacterium]|nr:hypothetical protein [Frankiales bacterium]